VPGLDPLPQFVIDNAQPFDAHRLDRTTLAHPPDPLAGVRVAPELHRPIHDLADIQTVVQDPGDRIR
jgi:hypothetical protein